MKYSIRKHSYPAGGPGKTMCEELDEELSTWFVESIQNVKGRLPAFLLMEMAHSIAADLQSLHLQEKERGRVPLDAILRTPKLEGGAGYSYLRRWRSKFGITYRTVSLRFKCARSVLTHRLKAFWSNVLRVRILHTLLVRRDLERDGGLFMEGFDQKPMWFTSASAERTYNVKGRPKVAVKENVPLSRSRFTVMTRCRHPEPPTDDKETAVLFKASGGGIRIRNGLRTPPDVLLQLQEKGSYRLQDVVEYMEWILDRSRAGLDGGGGRRRAKGDCKHERGQRRRAKGHSSCRW